MPPVQLAKGGAQFLWWGSRHACCVYIWVYCMLLNEGRTCQVSSLDSY